jgi:hypothetical protein
MARFRGVWIAALPIVVAVGLFVLTSPPVGRAQAGPDEPAAVRRPIPPNMLEAYGEGQVVAVEYHQTYYCPTTPSSDLEPPYGRGDGRRQSEDADEYQVPPCFFGDTGTGSVLPEQLRAAAFPNVKTFWGMAPFFGTALGTANTPASDVFTHCTEPGPPISERKGEFGTCLMHPSTLRFAKIFDDPTRQPPDPVALPQHSHLVPETSSRAAWWNQRGVAIYDRAIWPDADGNCPAGPPHCVTSVAALRAAQKTGQASIDVPSNVYFYLTVHPETR